MNKPISYRHTQTASLASHLTRLALILLRRKTSIEREIIRNRFRHRAAPLPAALQRLCHISRTTVNGRPVLTLRPRQNPSRCTVFYLHGGAYTRNITRFHWHMIRRLIALTNASFVVPDYPLAPDAGWCDVYEFTRQAWQQLTEHTAAQDIILMGDSAGAGLALGFAQQLQAEHSPQPGQIILLSPWLDIASDNPAMAAIESADHMLAQRGLQRAAGLYAAGISPHSYLVSPLYGDFSQLAPLSVFTGTADILYPDVLKLRDRLSADHIPLNYFEYPRMMHVWMAVNLLPEAQQAQRQIAGLICSVPATAS